MARALLSTICRTNCNRIHAVEQYRSISGEEHINNREVISVQIKVKVNSKCLNDGYHNIHCILRVTRHIHKAVSFFTNFSYSSIICCIIIVIHCVTYLLLHLFCSSDDFQQKIHIQSQCKANS